MVSKWVITYLLNRIYWGYNPLTNHLLTSWDIQVGSHLGLLILLIKGLWSPPSSLNKAGYFRGEVGIGGVPRSKLALH